MFNITSFIDNLIYKFIIMFDIPLDNATINYFASQRGDLIYIDQKTLFQT